MGPKLLVSTLAVLAISASVHAEVKGTFIGPGTYATKDGCEKLAKIAAGGNKNVGTVPETLTVDGFIGWEGACTFRSITEKQPGKVWTAKMDCFEGATEGPESDIFERMADGTLKVTIMDSSTMMQRCDTDRGK